jgi:phosphoglycolate phosphatase
VQRRSPQARVYVVGDTPADILAARANKMQVIAVATGIYEVEELLPYAPDMCISSCADLLSLP